MKPPFKLLPAVGSADTGLCVESLREGHRTKRLIGLAYVAIYQQRNYEVHVCGEAARSPTFARGAVGALIDKLSRMQQGEDE